MTGKSLGRRNVQNIVRYAHLTRDSTEVRADLNAGAVISGAFSNRP